MFCYVLLIFFFHPQSRRGNKVEGHFALTHLHRSGKVFARSRDKQNKPVFIIQGNSFFASFTSENNS